MAPKIPNDPGPISAKNSLVLDVAGEKGPEKGTEEKVVGGRGRDSWGNIASKRLKIKGEKVGERNQKI